MAMRSAIAWILSIAFVWVLGCESSGETGPLFEQVGGSTSASTSAASAGQGGSGGGTSSTTGTSGQGGGGPVVCDPAAGMNACEMCVLDHCCAEATACGPGTKCDAYSICARMAGCFEPGAGDFYECALMACPAESTNETVMEFRSLAECVRGNCELPCGI
jgi:hypothetical protein